MAKGLTVEDAKEFVTNHAAAKGTEIYKKYGPQIGWHQLLQILEDRTCCRYSCKVAFDSSQLEAGEFAYPAPKGQRPDDGFVMHVHPHFTAQLERVPYLVLYQLAVVNYGEFAGPEDAEIFGANALGISRDLYYEVLCAMADEIGGCGEPGCDCHRPQKNF
ncbi:MAG: hypothetical protein WCE51_03660 [Chthoniobacterales bacterium]